METLITVLVICVIAAALFWLIEQIPFGPPILKQIFQTIVIIAAILKIWPML